MFPELPVLTKPGGGVLHRLGPQPTMANSAFLATDNEPDGVQYP